MIFPLADSDDSAVKVIFGAIFVFIWIVSSLMSAASKKREEERRRRVRESIQLDRTLPPQLPLPTVHTQSPAQQAPPPMLRRIDLPPQQPIPSSRRPKPAKARRKGIAPPPVNVAQPPRVAVTAPAPVQAASPIMAPPAKVPASADATSLRSWLKPMTMRQQFILTEILQPPISMR